jgi:basic membrane protein A
MRGKGTDFERGSSDIRFLGMAVALGVVVTVILFGVLQSGSPAKAQGVAVGLVTDEGTLADMSFNWLSYQGLLRAKSELGVTGKVYTSTSEADYGLNLQQCVEDGNDLCISVGFGTAAAISSAAAANPGTAFAIVDLEFGSYPANLRGMIFASDEVGYLAGTLAGLMTQSDVVGSVAGMEIPPVQAFVEPYRHAAQCANPWVRAIVTYTGTFVDPNLGAEVAQEMIGKGADLVFGAGGATGTGAVLTATQSSVWGIGVDADQYISTFMNGEVAGSDKLLSSAMKRLDSAVFDTISDVVTGTFSSGTVLYDLAVDGVGLAPFHKAGSFVPSTVRARLERIKQDIIAGRIDVWGACPEYMTPTYQVVPPGVTTEFTGGGGLVNIAMGPDTVTETAVISFTPQVQVDPGASLVGTGFFYVLEATSQATGRPMEAQSAYTVTLSYTDEEVEAAQVVAESALALYFWDNGQWVKEPTCVVDAQANLITCTPDHFSLWGVLSVRHQVFLPLVVREYTP